MTIHYRTAWISGTHLDTKSCGAEIQLNAVHETHHEQRFLVMHGDKFDSIVSDNHSLAYIDGEAYEWLLMVSRWFNNWRKLLDTDQERPQNKLAEAA